MSASSQSSLRRAHRSEFLESLEHQAWLKRPQSYVDSDGTNHYWKSGEDLLKHLGRRFDRTDPSQLRTVEPQSSQPRLHSESVAVPNGSGGFSMFPLADSDECELYDARKSDKWRAASRARKTYLDICKRDTGNCGDPEKIRSDQLEREELKDHSHLIAAMLRSQGIDAYRSDPGGIWRYFPHSGCVQQLPKFRRICFLPSVAAALRAPIVKALESYIECNPFCRMWTFTSGVRAPLKSLRPSIKRFHRRLSKFSHWLRKTHRIEMVFRSTELGTPEINEDGTRNEHSGQFGRNSDGDATFHIHAHCLVRLIGGPRSREEWDSILKSVWSQWGSHWDDGKSVSDARELCKYVCKPGCILGLAPNEVATLYEELRRLKMVAPLGDLKDEIKRRKDSKLTLVRTPTPDGYVWEEVDDWNSHGEKKSKLENALDALPRKSVSDAPKILARMIPGFAPGSCVKEPSVIVMAPSWDRDAVNRHPMVERLRRETWDEWRAGLVASEEIRVHKGTPTVRETSEMDWYHDLEQRCRPDWTPIFEETEVSEG